MIDQSKPEGRIAAAALRLAAERPWSEISLRDIGEAAGLSLAEVRAARIGSKSQVLVLINKAIDTEVIAKAPRRDPSQPVRDTLFEVVMARFDTMQPYRSGIRSILQGAGADAALLRSLLNSQYWMLQAAGLDAEGTQGRIRLFGLASIYGAVLQTWLDDDDPGLARTMAALDRRLRSGERTMQGIKGACGGLRRLGDTVRDIVKGARRSDTSQSETSAPPSAEPPPVGTPAF